MSDLTTEQITEEWIKCCLDPAFFIDNYVYIFNASDSAWIPFRLWASQIDFLEQLEGNKQVIVMKARQLGMTWCVLGYALHMMIFRPAATVLLFSYRDDEAMILKSRLEGMYERLPDWMKCKGVTVNNAHEFYLSNGSSATASTTTSGGRSLTAKLLIADEFDFVTNVAEFLAASKPTIDAGDSKFVIISTVDKSRPTSSFKTMFRAAVVGENSWTPIFYPWSARPDRTPAWYERVKKDALSQEGGLDAFLQEYPANVDEALAPRQQDKRFPSLWITQCVLECNSIAHTLSLPGLTIYRLPELGGSYSIGADVAEGNPNSDFSVAIVIDTKTLEEVAILSGKIEPGTLGEHIHKLSEFYGYAPIMIERNNHGHAAILRLKQLEANLLVGYDKKVGWLTSSHGKTLLFDLGVEILRDGATRIASFVVRDELMSIEAASQAAPAGMHDDHAMAFLIALMSARWAQQAALVLPIAPTQIGEYSYDPRGDYPVWAIYDSYIPEDDCVRRAIIMLQVVGDELHLIREDYADNMSLQDQLDGILSGLSDREWPEYVVVRRRAHEHRTILAGNSLYTRVGFPNLQDGLREMRRVVSNLRISDKCVVLLRELSRYRYAPGRDVPNEAYEHGPLALIDLVWSLRHE